MRSERVAFVPGMRCRPELLLTVRALVAALVAEGVAAGMTGGADGGETVSVQIDGEELAREVASVRLAPGALRVELRGGDDPDAIPVPLLVPPLERRHALSVLVAGGAGERRLRMTARVLEVLRRRASRLRRVGWLEFPEELVRSGTLDEIHAHLDAEELERLLGGAAVVLDAAPEPELRTPLGELAVAAGIPLVTHEGAGVAASDRIRAVAEWSDESLAEAVDEAARLGWGPARDPAPTILRLRGVLPS